MFPHVSPTWTDSCLLLAFRRHSCKKHLVKAERQRRERNDKSAKLRIPTVTQRRKARLKKNKKVRKSVRSTSLSSAIGTEGCSVFPPSGKSVESSTEENLNCYDRHLAQAVLRFSAKSGIVGRPFISCKHPCPARPTG